MLMDNQINYSDAFSSSLTIFETIIYQKKYLAIMLLSLFASIIEQFECNSSRYPVFPLTKLVVCYHHQPNRLIFLRSLSLLIDFKFKF